MVVYDRDNNKKNIIAFCYFNQSMSCTKLFPAKGW